VTNLKYREPCGVSHFTFATLEVLIAINFADALREERRQPWDLTVDHEDDGKVPA